MFFCSENVVLFFMIVGYFVHSCEMCVRYLNKNVDDFEAVCKSLEVTERYWSLNYSVCYVEHKLHGYQRCLCKHIKRYKVCALLYSAFSNVNYSFFHGFYFSNILCNSYCFLCINVGKLIDCDKNWYNSKFAAVESILHAAFSNIGVVELL